MFGVQKVVILDSIQKLLNKIKCMNDKYSI